MTTGGLEAGGRSYVIAGSKGSELEYEGDGKSSSSSGIGADSVGLGADVSPGRVGCAAAGATEVTPAPLPDLSTFSYIARI